MGMRRLIWILSALTALLCITGCAKVQTRAVDTRVAGEVLVDPAQLPVYSERDEAEEPQALVAPAVPLYPAELIAARLPPIAVTVRIVVNPEGRVAEVEALAAEPALAEAPAFVEAIRTAAAQWRYRPYRVIRWRELPDQDGDGLADGEEMVANRALPFRFDMRYRFEVVEGKASVSQP